MKCPRCQGENDAGARFCEDCGARLEIVCPSCSAPVTPGKKFCRSCGTALSAEPTSRFASAESYTPKHLAEKILNSKSALEGERKQVTVLFADLKGSMELLADRDPEEARKILDPVLELMMEAVHRYEGTVNQVMGDGIMALFGAPLAHEDHTVRACYAALRMQSSVKRYAEGVQRAAGVPIQIRVGLNSGEVVVRSIGSDLHMDYTAVGQTTHLAARMEQMAMAGSILLSADALRLAEGFVEVKPLGPVNIKGLSTPVEVYEVTGAGPARTRLQAATRRGLTRFVGRDAEVEHLRRVLGQAGSGRGQVVAIVGEAGAGKSRITYEFTHSHRVQGWLILEGSSASYGKSTSYLPVIDLLKGYFRIADRDDHGAVRAKVLGRLLSADRALEALLPTFLALLDVPVEDAAWQRLDPPQRRQRTLDAVKRLLLREAQAQPLLVVFEDLHWVDGETQALLDALVDSLGSARLLLLVTYRPEYQHAWGTKTTYSQLRVDTLPAESAGELLEALLGEDPEVEPLKQLLVKRGNPFFLEETIRALVETRALSGERGRYRLTQPVQALQVPPTIQSILAARIDRLSAEDKRLLQVASVVGKDVPFALLQAIADLPDEALRGGLERLQAAEFVYETGLFPDLEYSFKHALTHEVTYSGLLQDRRREIHGRIVEAVETVHRDRLGGEIERLAHHAVRGELREKAVYYLREAGLKAAARSALPDARGWFEQALGAVKALALSPSTLEQGFELRLELRPVLVQLGELTQALERLREAEILAEKLNDHHRRSRVYAFVTNIHNLLGELDEALVTGTRALEIAGRFADLKLRVLARHYLGQVHLLSGDYEPVVELATENVTALPSDWMAERFGIPAPVAVADRVWLVLGLAELGRFVEAGDCEADMIRLAASMHGPYTVGWSHFAAATLHLLKGDWAQARVLIEQAIAVIQAGNVLLILPHAVASSAWALAQLGETSTALERIREGEGLVERHAASKIVAFRGWNYCSLARACLLLGRLDEAQRLGNRAAQCDPPQRGYVAHAMHLLGDIATHPDRFDAEHGETHYREALALADSRGMRPLVAHCHLGLGKLYHRTDEPEQAEKHLATATRLYREMGMTYWLEKAEAEMRDFS